MDSWSSVRSLRLWWCCPWLGCSPEVLLHLSQGITVLFGYIALAVPPLLILRQQLKTVDASPPPPGGWLQWRPQPVGMAVLQALRGWLMMPVVLTLAGVAGDRRPGRQQPLLEIVLTSNSSLALFLLATTAVVLAPLFEETIFRGVLLPVSAVAGRAGGVMVSALVFAVAHLSLGELPPLLVLGLGLGLLRLSTGRLLPCVVMHALWNGVTFLNLLLLGAEPIFSPGQGFGLACPVPDGSLAH